MEKSHLTVNGNSVRVSMPFAKVDQAKRLVHGFATLDNVDSEGDVVTAAASARAFSRARGNLREMHDNIAAGRIVDFREDEFFDKESGETYRGMYVTARVSEGAPNTWIKVLDGTLSGFSIGGEIVKSSNKVNKSGKSVREIEDYDLNELSLVDNPANPLANVDSFEKTNVVSFVKSAGGSVKITGMAAETILENVFICPNDSTVIIKTVDALSCPECETNMEMAGWFEEGPDRTEKVRDIVNKYLGAAAEEATAPGEGGVEMEKGKETTDDNAVVGVESEPVALEVDETVDSDDKAQAEVEIETPDEVADETSVLVKKIDELHETLKETLEEANVKHDGRFQSLEKRIDEVHNETSQLASQLEKLGEGLDVAKARMSEIEKSLSKMNDADALRKSVESEDDTEPQVVQKSSSWNGAFSGGSRRDSFIDSL